MRNRVLAVLGVSLLVGIVLYIFGIRSTKLSVAVAPEPVFCIGGVRESAERCASGIPITDSMILTYIVLAVIIIVAVAATRNMKLVPTGLQNTVETVVEFLYTFGQSVDRKNVGKFFPIYATIFIFFLFSNFSGLVPGVSNIGVCAPEHAAGEAHAEGEAKAEKIWIDTLPGSCAEGTKLVPFLRSPSTDLNVTFAYALVAVFMVQYFGFQALGLGYLTKFFNFKEGAMGTFVGIMELISEFVRIMAFAFRLFGNLFAGKTVIVVMTFLFPYLLPLPFYGLEVFVAVIQAVIFAVLTLVFMSLAVVAHGHDDHGHGTPVEAADLPGHGGSH
jgi:F-type H+-transporting ATPase subunit a